MDMEELDISKERRDILAAAINLMHPEMQVTEDDILAAGDSLRTNRRKAYAPTGFVFVLHKDRTSTVRLTTLREASIT